jgi:hypothetical protein
MPPASYFLVISRVDWTALNVATGTALLAVCAGSRLVLVSLGPGLGRSRAFWRGRRSGRDGDQAEMGSASGGCGLAGDPVRARLGGLVAESGPAGWVLAVMRSLIFMACGRRSSSRTRFGCKDRDGSRYPSLLPDTQPQVKATFPLLQAA